MRIYFLSNKLHKTSVKFTSYSYPTARCFPSGEEIQVMNVRPPFEIFAFVGHVFNLQEIIIVNSYKCKRTFQWRIRYTFSGDLA